MLERADKAGFATKESFSPIQTPRLLGGRKLRLFFGTSGRKSLLKVGRRTRGDLGFFPLPPPLSDTGVNWLTKKGRSDEMSSFLPSFFLFFVPLFIPLLRGTFLYLERAESNSEEEEEENGAAEERKEIPSLFVPPPPRFFPILVP